MKVEITKQLVLDAIEHENIALLDPGAWVFLNNPEGKATIPEICPRCMVGCVLSKVVSEFHTINRAATAATRGHDVAPDMSNADCIDEADVRMGAIKAIENGRPLNGLSYFFEGMCMIYAADEDEDIDALPRHMVEEIRAAALVFVARHFPDTMVIDIDGASAVKGIPVIEP